MSPTDKGDYASGSDRINRGVFSSNTELWVTPDALFKALDDEFDFTLDPCATDENAKCDRYFTEADDGLAQYVGRCADCDEFGDDPDCYCQEVAA